MPAARKKPEGWTLEAHKYSGFAVLKDGEQITVVQTRDQGEEYIARLTNDDQKGA